MERIRENPTQQPVNGKLQRAIMWTQVAEITEGFGVFEVPWNLRNEINSIESIDLVEPLDNKPKIKVFK